VPGRPKVAVVIPALNEAGNVGSVVHGLRAQEVDATITVVVTDNGSTDSTADEARAAGAIVVSEARRGYGWACAAGSAKAIELGVDAIAYIDADHSSLPDELGLLIEPWRSGQADLVLGSRALGTIAAGAMGAHQRFGNVLTAAIMRRLYRVTVTDLGPYRLIDTDLLVALDMTEMTFGWPTEMMVKSARRGARIVEIPVTWNARHSGDSKVSGTIKGSILAGWYLLSVTVKHAFGRAPTPWSAASSETVSTETNRTTRRSAQ